MPRTSRLPLESPNLTKSFLLIATGVREREDMARHEIHMPSWDKTQNGYRRKLEEANLIGCKKGYRNKTIYQVNWPRFLIFVKELIISDLKLNSAQLYNGFIILEGDENKATENKLKIEIRKREKAVVSEKKLKSELKKIRDKYKKFNIKKNEIQFIELQKKHVLLKSKLIKVKELRREFEKYEKEIQLFIPSINDDLFPDKKTENYILSQFIGYFRQLLLFKEKFDSISNEIRYYLDAIAKSDTLHHFPRSALDEPVFNQYPFDDKLVDKKKVHALIKNYYKYKNTNIYTLIVDRPELQKQVETEFEEHLLDEECERKKHYDSKPDQQEKE